MARKPNYGFEKRKKELDRKAKKDAKRDERERRRREGIADESGDTPPSDGLTPEDEPQAPGAA